MNLPKVINLFKEVPHSFTLTIPSRKKVYWQSRRRIFSQLSLSNQCSFLNNLLMKIIWQNHYTYIDWVFERHEPDEYDKIGRLHIHGYALIKKEYINIKPLHLLADAFYTHNKIIGIAPSVYPRLCNIQQTILDIQYWYQYISKHIAEMPHKSPYNSQKFLINSIDNPYNLNPFNVLITDTSHEVEI